jgi:hypothetical protein
LIFSDICCNMVAWIGPAGCLHVMRTVPNRQVSWRQQCSVKDKIVCSDKCYCCCCHHNGQCHWVDDWESKAVKTLIGEGWMECWLVLHKRELWWCQRQRVNNGWMCEGCLCGHCYCYWRREWGQLLRCDRRKGVKLTHCPSASSPGV